MINTYNQIGICTVEKDFRNIYSFLFMQATFQSVVIIAKSCLLSMLETDNKQNCLIFIYNRLYNYFLLI